MVGGSLTSGVLLAAHSAAPAGAVQPHQRSLRSSRLCVLRCCGELLVSGLLQPPAASLSWLAQQLSVICQSHVTCQSCQSAVSSQQPARLARLLTPDFLEQTDELGIGSGILSPLNLNI